MIFGQDRGALRKMYSDAWQKRCDGIPMSPLEIQIADVIALAHKLTASNVHDGPILPKLLEEVEAPLAQVSADKAYDSFACHKISSASSDAIFWKSNLTISLH